MNIEQLKRLKTGAISRSIPSLPRDEAIDKELEEMGFIELNKHGAKITEKGIQEINDRGILR